MLPLQAYADRGLEPIDWIIILGFILLSIGIGIVLSKRARGSSEQYFKGGGGMGWLLLGTSMVATTFAADTPLALTGWVVTSGVSQNWYWWSMVPVTMMGVFFFARLWKRANPMTDMEFVYVRYSGKSANWLRVGKALWLAFPYGCIVMGWVNKAMGVIINYLVPEFPRIPVVDGLMLALFLGTPLSSNVDDAVVDAVRSDEINAVDIGYDLGILERPTLWTDYSAGRYDSYTDADGVEHPDERQVVLDELNLTQIDLHDVGTIPGIPGGFQLAGVENADSAQVIFEIYEVCSGVNQYKILFLLFLIVIAYTSISGLWGVMVTDFIQFWIAMVGCIILAVLAVQSQGGMESLLIQMQDIYGVTKARAMVFPLPTEEAVNYGLFTQSQFLLFIFVFWWTFGFTDGGSYFAQRMLSAKDERNAAMGYLWYAVAHYALRMWPWLLVGFVAAVVYPYLPFPNGNYPGGPVAEAGYVKIMLDVLPAGLLGLLTASLLAAYMSTISTQVNLGASYLMNDVYKPFIAGPRERRIREMTGDSAFQFSEKHYVRIGILMTLVMALAGLIVSLFLNEIGAAWFLLAGFNGGIGVIYILRWYWWRINAWSELVCLMLLLVLTYVMRAALLGAFGFDAWLPESFTSKVLFEGTFWQVTISQFAVIPYSLLITVPLSVGLALLVTFLTPPVHIEQLKAFHRKVQAGGIGWRKIDRLVKEEDPDFHAQTPLRGSNVRNWILASATVYFWLVGLGKLVIGDTLLKTFQDGQAVDILILHRNVLFVYLMLGLGVAGLVALATGKRLSGYAAAGITVAVMLLGYFLLSPAGTHAIEAVPTLAHLFTNRITGLLMVLVGVGCGWVVANSFSHKQWAEGVSSRPA